jgi:hypothetical protein
VQGAGGEQVDAQKYKSETSDFLDALPPSLADPGACCQPDLRGCEAWIASAAMPAAAGRWLSPMLKPITSSSRLMLSPRATSAIPVVRTSCPALSSSSSPASSIQPPIPITAAPAM